METDSQAAFEGWAPPQLQQVQPTGAGTLDLVDRTPDLLDRPSRSRREFWVLTQAGRPVGTLERAKGGAVLRTASEEWRMAVRRRAKRLGWYLHFGRVGRGETACQYEPRTLWPGGDLVLAGERRYRLRSRLVRADWRLAAVPGGDVGSLGLRDRGSGRHLQAQLASGDWAADEPLLSLVILAASAAILIHHEQPSGGSGGGGVW